MAPLRPSIAVWQLTKRQTGPSEWPAQVVSVWVLPSWALVAELVDALASGASFRKEVEVRVFSRAPFFYRWTAFFLSVIWCDKAGFRPDATAYFSSPT